MTTKEIAKTAIVEFMGTFAIIFFGSINIDINKDSSDFLRYLAENAIVNFFLIMTFMWMSSKKFGA